MNKQLSMNTEDQDGILTLHVHGRIDAANLGTFHEMVEQHMKNVKRGLVLNCENLLYISSAGLRSILLHAKNAQSREVGFVLCSLPDTIKEIVRIAGFNKIMEIRESQAQAVAYVKA